MSEIRPMALDDVDSVMAVVNETHHKAERQAGREPEQLSDEERERFRRGTERFVERDPQGAWVATEEGRVIGMAEAIRRGPFWGLSMLFVLPDSQSKGVGRRLLDASLTYADGARVRMILTSFDPRALRRYSLAGLAIHPTVEAHGAVDRSAIPAGLPGRDGDAGDLDLVADVDAGLRGSRAEDVEFVLDIGVRMQVVERGAARGFAVYRPGRLMMLGATDEGTAAQVLWRVLADGADGDKAEVWGLTASQDWAVRVALAARLKVSCSGPLFIDGLDRPPGPWIPSGWFF